MAQQNQIDIQIADKDMSEILAALATLKAKLVPHLKSLTPQDRHEMAKMGDKTVAFVQKALEYAQKNPQLVPAFLDLSAFASDVAGVSTLRQLDQDLTAIVQALDDSMTLAGSEAYQAALVFYSSVKNAAKNAVPGAGVVYDDLSARFPGGPSKKKA